MVKLCPRCKLGMSDDKALNALSHDGKNEVCSICGQIESLEGLGLFGQAEGLRVSQQQAQAAHYGLDKNGKPKTPP
ncbi:hypothetical protein MUP77_05060 [Candidatus Bathyarchaeota archaeon]|nr:hypothetical protein [Candidatus Bathyarchaeota archaeon]